MSAGLRIAPLARPEEVEASLRDALLALERSTQDRPLGWDALTREVGPTVATPGALLVALEADAADAAPDAAAAPAADAATDAPVACGGSLLGLASAQLLVEDVHVLRLAVVPGARRRGIGRQLLDGLVGWAAELDAAAVVLEVRAGNVAARTLYASAGVVEDGLRRGYYPDGEDAVLLRRASTGPRGRVR